MAEQGKKLGIDQLKLMAARSDEYQGYITWPIMGYDGPLKASLISALPEPLSEVRTVQRLLDTGDGRNWWYENGDTLPLTFSLKADSPNLKDWSEYWSRLPSAEKAKAMERLKGEAFDPGSRGKTFHPETCAEGFTREQILADLEIIGRIRAERAEEGRKAQAGAKEPE
jgi:hypothetical protein